MLSPIRRKPRQRKFIAYDLEWYPDTYQLRMLGAYDGTDYRPYKTVPDFLNGELCAENAGAWFYAHAGGLYDFRFILEYLVALNRSDIRVSAIFSGSSAIIIQLRKGNKKWWFIDSYWLLRQPLRKIGEWLGFPKASQEDGEIFYADFKSLCEYNYIDCKVLWHAIDAFETTLLQLGGQLEMTVASSALGLFRRAFLRDKIRTCPQLNETARNAYIASRVEVIRQSCESANYYDINSSFPYAMTFDAPGNFLKSNRRIPDDDRFYMADCTITVPEMYLPPIPYRADSHRIFFPSGTWRNWLTRTDVELLQECSGILHTVHEVWHFERFGQLREYAERIYELRKVSKSEAEKQILKILLNSLYGKFGEASVKSKMWLNPPSEFFSETEGKKRFELSPGIWLVDEEINIPHAHVPIAAHITAVARKVLYDHMRGCSDVYYCDTDGFACNPADNFPTSPELGALKLEKIVQKGIFAAPKLYAYEVPSIYRDSHGFPCFEDSDWTIKAKGFSRVRVPGSYKTRPLEYRDFCSLLENKELMIDRFVRIKEGARKNDWTPRGMVQAKAWRATAQPKRKFDADGTSRPWRIHELETK